jgi:hypothetical protein
LKDIEQETAKLKRLVSELSLEKLVLKDIASGNFLACVLACCGVRFVSKSKLRLRMPPLQGGELLPKWQILQKQATVGTKKANKWRAEASANAT